MTERAFLFLQGPSSPFFALIAKKLEAKGHKIYRINLCVGDQLFWRRPGAVNYRGRLSEWSAFIDAFLNRNGITDILLLGEQRDHHKIAIKMAKQHGIAVTVTDFGYLRPDWIILEREGMSALSQFPRDPQAILDLAAQCIEPDFGRIYEDSFWRMALSEMAYHFSTYFFWWLFPHYRSFKVENPVLAYLGTGRRLLLGSRKNREVETTLAELEQNNTPYYLFPLQMENDFQIRAYSHYPDMETPIAEVIASFAGHADASARLIVKVHPWDQGLKNWGKIVRKHAIRHGVSDRVHYLDGGNLYDMIRKSVGMVTINSTSGIQALCMDAPLITLGQAIFDIPGLTFQGSIDDFWTQAPPPDPALREAFLKATAATLQIRGVFYRQPGLDAAVSTAVRRLHENRINEALEN
jgi:capsular polysaccharide export protein